MLKLYGKKNKKLTVDLSTVNELKENDKILIASNGKMKQIDQDLVNIGGGGSTPDGPTFNDGKTRLFVTVASVDLPTICVNLGCTVVGGVTIDWGDGSDTEVTTNTARTTYSHSYSAAGDYIIALEVTDGELILEGVDDGSSIMQLTPYQNAIPYYGYVLKRVEIGGSVTNIGKYAFYGCYALTSVAIPSSVTSIGDNAFYGCYALTSVAIPSSVTSIGDNVFSGCYAITSVAIPSRVTSIGDNAFADCYALSSITIPSSVTSIGDNAFAGCYALSSITIPSSVTSIGDNAFADCYALTSVAIPSSVTSIGEHAFADCYAITSVAIPSRVTSIGTNVFSGCPITSVTFREGITSIGDYMFGGSNLTSITIPSSVTSIGEHAFADCQSLAAVHILSTTPPTIGKDAFSNILSGCKIYIPAGSLEAYSTATNWSNYVSMLVEE